VHFLGFAFLVISLFMTGGVLLVLAGIFVMLRLREKYAVRIITAEGEKNLVVSQSREYISQIVDALNRAFLDLMTSGKKEKISSKLK
jgi:ABC-type amino acid transport substrate-binding protein